MVCNKCHGQGTVVEERWESNYHVGSECYEYEVECDLCKGAGFFEENSVFKCPTCGEEYGVLKMIDMYEHEEKCWCNEEPKFFEYERTVED